MAEPLSVIPALGQLLEWLKEWVKVRGDRTEAAGRAVKALLDAVTATHLYIGDQAQEGIAQINPEKRAREERLAVLWADAAYAFYQVDPNVAPLMQLKSEAWARPDQWSDERCREAGISIEEISTRLTGFLQGR
jgi:hypothetical protein